MTFITHSATSDLQIQANKVGKFPANDMFWILHYLPTMTTLDTLQMQLKHVKANKSVWDSFSTLDSSYSADFDSQVCSSLLLVFI